MSALITCTSCQHDWLKPTAGSLSKVWTQPGCCGKKGCRVPAPDGADSPMPPWAHRAGTCTTKQAGTDRKWWSLTAGSRHRKPACGHVQDIGWAEHWRCDSCSAPVHQRDDNAAVNLARYEEPISVVGPVGAAVKGGADRKTVPRPAGGREARKRRSHTAAEQPPDGVQVA